MQVILLERIQKLGQMGDEVSVKPGYARNFLLPLGKALRATKENKARFEVGKAQLEAQNLEKRGEAVAVEAYRTLRPPVDGDSLGQRLGDSEFDVASFASPSAVAYFAELLGDGARAALRGVTVTALGETTAAALRDVGIEPDVVPERPELHPGGPAGWRIVGLLHNTSWLFDPLRG